jgi:hypothetical protein
MKENERDTSDHLYTYLFRFKSTHTKLTYILRAEFHKNDVFGIKFFAKAHRHSEKKYSLLTNKGYALRIFLTCASVVPELLKCYPKASFGLIGSRMLDEKNQKIEDPNRNIRYRIYQKVIEDLFGHQTFEHYAYPKISGYLLVNKHRKVGSTKAGIENMFIENYRDIHNYEDIIHS